MVNALFGIPYHVLDFYFIVVRTHKLKHVTSVTPLYSRIYGTLIH